MKQHEGAVAMRAEDCWRLDFLPARRGGVLLRQGKRTERNNFTAIPSPKNNPTPLLNQNEWRPPRQFQKIRSVPECPQIA